MALRIEKIAVLGAGTMGSRIAAHLANAGMPCWLLVEQRGWSYGDFVVSSFHRAELRALSDPRIPVALLLARKARRVRRA